MKLLLYMAILLAVLLFPSRGVDVGKLIPVEVIAVSESDGILTVSTDTGDLGRGRTIQAAVEDMKASAPGVIYLDTAEYLLIEPGAENQINAIRGYLKGTVRVCYGREGIPLEGIADFLSVHNPESRLDGVGDPSQIATITEENGRYKISGK